MPCRWLSHPLHSPVALCFHGLPSIEYLPRNINLSPILGLQITTQFPSLKKKKKNLIWLLANTNLWSLRNMTSYLSIPGSVANHCLTYYLTILSFLLISFEVRLSDFFEIYKHSCRKRKQWFKKKKKTLSFTFIEYQR